MKKPLHLQTTKKLPEKRGKIKPTKILKVFCVAIEYCDFFANSPELQLLQCVRISVFSVSRHLQNQGFEVWLWVCFCLRSGLRFQCLFSFSFPVPPTRVEGTTCLMILSLEVGKEGYSKLSFVILHHWLPFLNLQSLTWMLPPCTWRIEALCATREVRNKYFSFSIHCIVELSQKTKGSPNICLEKCGSKHCLPRKTGMGLCCSFT